MKEKKEGICPICQSRDLKGYETPPKVYDGFISFFLECGNCGGSFEEDYEIIYMGQNCIEDVNGNEVEI